MRPTTTEEIAAGDYDLRAFHIRILAVVADSATPPAGADIKDRLNEYYGREVTHGRLYPNLDELREKGLLTRSSPNARRHAYRLSDSGRAALRAEVRWLTERVDAGRGHDGPDGEQDLRADGGEAPPMYCPGCQTLVPEHYDPYDEAFRCPDCGSHTYESKAAYIETVHATARFNKEHGWGPFHERNKDGDDARADGGQDRPRLEHGNADIATGDVVVDLASGQALQVVGKSTQTVGEHRATQSDGTTELFGADADEPVYMCVYLPDGDRLSPPSKTYAYPESRLLRYPVEDATDYAGSIQTWIRTAVLDELADGLARSGNERLASEVVALVGDVYNDSVAETVEEMIQSHGNVEADR